MRTLYVLKFRHTYLKKWLEKLLSSDQLLFPPPLTHHERKMVRTCYFNLLPLRTILTSSLICVCIMCVCIMRSAHRFPPQPAQSSPWPSAVPRRPHLPVPSETPWSTAPCAQTAPTGGSRSVTYVHVHTYVCEEACMLFVHVNT